jgi:hypothetical protein
MGNYNWRVDDFLYQEPNKIVKFLTRGDLEIIIRTLPNDIESLELLEILLMNFEVAEYYEYCCSLRDEINLRIDFFEKEYGKK